MKLLLQKQDNAILKNNYFNNQVSGGGAGLDRILFHSLKQKLTNQVNSTIKKQFGIFH